MTAREQQARAEISRRRALAEDALTTVDDQLRPIAPPTTWHQAHEVTRRLQTSQGRGAHIAANDPAHVLAVLAAFSAILDEHALADDADLPWQVVVGRSASTPYCAVCADEDGCGEAWPCATVAAVLDLYAPEPTP